MKVYSYVVARDFGFAPNPFYGSCTLATCKPEIRKTASIGDWIVGTGSNELRRSGHIVFAMCVAEALTFNQYWADPRFQHKKPYLIGSKKQAFGDNIYHRENDAAPWHQENSHHSLNDGTPNQKNVLHDTRVDRVLIGFDYIYWGGSGPEIPPVLCEQLCKRGPGHKCNFPDEFVAAVIVWLRAHNAAGFVGAPLDWVRTA